MADIKATSLGGVPKGTTANRPTSPAVGDVFYNGTLGCLEIYTSTGWVANSAPPAIPTIGNITYSGSGKAYNNSSASVAFSPGEGGGLPNSYRATSNPGGFSTSSSTSPIVVSGLQSGVSYTFSVTGTNNFGTSAASANSSSISANTVPDAPVIGTLSYVSNTSLSLTFTAPATGGSSITNYKYSIDGTNYTTLSPAQTTGPLTLSGLTAATNYAFYIKAVNANGDSVASSISNNVFTGPTVSGGILSSDATYYYRTFISNGTLSISNVVLSADILTIAGGGSGGAQVGGGGGAGGLLYSSASALSPTSYSVAIGAGAPYPPNYNANGDASNKGQKGSDSSFIGGSISIISAGGGGGSGYSNQAGPNGGSGGGADGQGQTNYGSGTVGQGNRGGSGFIGSWAGGGGGGSGSIGGNASANIGGDGGSGSNSYSSWISAIAPQMSGVTGWSTATSGGYIAAGGGGCNTSTASGRVGAGGAGGGASGASDNVTGGVAVINTGSGGGGSRDQRPPTSGSSGLIIVRYTKSQLGG
jgi:hypothetical protein